MIHQTTQKSHNTKRLIDRRMGISHHAMFLVYCKRVRSKAKNSHSLFSPDEICQICKSDACFAHQMSTAGLAQTKLSLIELLRKYMEKCDAVWFGPFCQFYWMPLSQTVITYTQCDLTSLSAREFFNHFTGDVKCVNHVAIRFREDDRRHTTLSLANDVELILGGRL